MLISLLSRPLFLITALILTIATNVSGGKMQLLYTPLLATFYPEEEYSGFPFKIHGFYNACYNFHGLVESITLGKVTAYCEVYSIEDCGEDEYDVAWREISGPTPRVMDDKDQLYVPGISAIRSVRCILDEDMVKELKEEVK